MKKFVYLKEDKLNYKGKQYFKGQVLEFVEFDNSLPKNWFKEIVEPVTISQPKGQIMVGKKKSR